MKISKVSLKERSYHIFIGEGILKKSGILLRGLRIGSDAVIITNKRLLGLYGKILSRSLENSGFTTRFEIVPDSEKAKSADIAIRLLNKIASYDLRKKIFIVAFGGGVVGDLAGFISSVYKRGVPYVQIPTTLVAQVDSAIGGKTAIDLPIAKNLIGSFYQPKAVLSDISLLKTLPAREMRNGLAEVVKYAVIKDPKLFVFLEENYKKVLNCDEKSLEYIARRSSRIKAGVVSKDEFDRKGLRAILNYGHTVGHAVEAASGYSGRYNHGEAVAIGMAAACDIALRLRMISAGERSRIINLIDKIGLPSGARGLSAQKIYASLLHDKKFVNAKNRFVLPLRIGAVKVADGVSDAIIKKALKNTIHNG